MSELYQKLREAMPKDVLHPPEPKSSSDRMRIQHHPIRSAAEQFAHSLRDTIPQDQEELQTTLWTFGELLFREMEKQLNYSMKLLNDVVALGVHPIVFSKEATCPGATSE